MGSDVPQYTIHKSSRVASNVYSYSGPSCYLAGVPLGKIYDNEEEAISDAAKLTEVNPVGFHVHKVGDPIE